MRRRPLTTMLAFIGVVLFSALEGRAQGQEQPVRKPRMADTIKANIYADNSFELYINGELVAVDSISFIPHNVISVDILPRYPMTIAVKAVDNADQKTGMEYANTNIGDGGFILKLGDGTVTNGGWRAKKVSWGPLNGDTRNPKAVHERAPEGWYREGFDDSTWSQAREYSSETIRPNPVYLEYDFEGAQFIWTEDVELDNVVLFRYLVETPPDGKKRPDFSNLTNLVPDQPRRGPGQTTGRGQSRPQ